MIEDCFFVGKNGSFCKRIELIKITEMKLSVCPKLGGFQVQNISGSLFSINKRVEVQNLDAYFDQANHGKRK